MLRINYPRHFALLTGFGVALGVLSHRQIPGNSPYAFALYGALHGASVVGALGAPPAAVRVVGFVGTAALLSQLTFWFGLESRHVLENLAVANGIAVLVAVCAGVGALAYSALIRAFRLGTMTSKDSLLIAVGCSCAALLAISAGRYLHVLSGWWLATLWWFAYSAGLRYVDRNVSRTRREAR